MLTDQDAKGFALRSFDLWYKKALQLIITLLNWAVEGASGE